MCSLKGKVSKTLSFCASFWADKFECLKADKLAFKGNR